jgi:predicted transcriptional regulator
VNPDSYHQARDNAVRDLANAVNQVKVIEKRIARLKQTIASLNALIEGEESIAEPKPDRQINLRQACREALKIANGPRTAKEIRDWLASSGYALGDQRNLLASIHTVLKRLVKAKEAVAATNAQGKTTYEWIGERGDTITTAIQQANYAIAKQINETVRSVVDSDSMRAAMVNASLESSKAVRRALEIHARQAAAISKQEELVSRVNKMEEMRTRANNTQKMLDDVSKKR